MSSFNEILGHQEIKEYLQNAILAGKVSHAYMLSGPDKSGKRMLANAFAKTLLCERGGAVACNECHSCIQAEHFNHPDIIYVQHEKPTFISVDEIRKQIVNDVDIKPYQSKWKIYIIDEADKMNRNAQNALLKTLEEPPVYAVILLLTDNSDAFLDTVLSRCVKLSLHPVPGDEIRSYLMEKHHVSEETAELAAAFSDGAVGKALTLATSEDFHVLRQSVIRLVKRVKRMETEDLIAAVREINDYKLTMNDYFNLLTVWYRDVLMYKATQEVDSLIFRDEIYEIKGQADRSSYQGIEEIIKAIDNAKKRLAANVNFDLTIELLLMTIKEN